MGPHFQGVGTAQSQDSGSSEGYTPSSSHGPQHPRTPHAEASVPWHHSLSHKVVTKYFFTAVSAVRTRQTEGASLAASPTWPTPSMPTCAGSVSLLQPKWRGQSCSGVLASSAVLAPVGKGPKTGRLTSAPYCRVKWRCVRLPRGHPRTGPQNLRAYCQLSRALTQISYLRKEEDSAVLV